MPSFPPPVIPPRAAIRSPFRGRALVAGLTAVTALCLGAVVTAEALASPTFSVPFARASNPYRPGVVLVGFRAGVSASEQRRLAGRAGARWKHVLGASSRGTRAARRLDRKLGLTVELGVAAGRELQVVRRLRRYSRWIRFAEPDFLLEASAARNVPNDPSFSLQWGSLNTGQPVNGSTGSPGADDGAASAWTVSTGSRAIVIGEVDTGVDYNHPDLSANVWSNPGGVGGCPAGTHGYNIVSSTCNPLDDDTSYGGHGTHVAGILGATGNNATGVAGMNWATTILPVKWLNSSAQGSTAQLISALDWMVKAKQAGVNVRVVNDSATFYGTAFSQALSDEIDLLGANNILFVTAAGNTGDNNDDPTVGRYPCRYDRANEICVTATDQNDQLPSWANYGPTTVDLGAPGNNVYSTLRNGSYGFVSGGSMASPQVAGAAALILSAQDMSATALKADILNNVDPVPGLAGLVRTGGRLDVCKAMPSCGSVVSSPPANTGVPTIAGAPQSGQTLSASSGSWTNSPTSFAFAWQRCDAAGGSCVPISGATGSTYVVQAADVSSTLRVTVTASNSAGPSAPVSSLATAVVTAAPATLGTTSVGGSGDTFAANRKRVNAYSLPVSGSVSKLSLYLAPTSTSGQANVKGVIYADSGGAPGALLAVSNELVFSSTQAAGWYDLALPSAVSLAAGRYWIGVITGGTSGVMGFRYASVSGSRDYNSNAYTSAPSNPFGAVSTDSEQMSVYATYTPSQAATSPPANSSLPSISGTPRSAQTLSASPGSWTNSPTGFSYVWQRCDASGANCAAISGATASSYVVRAADVSFTLRVVVTASNAAGSSTPASSAPTAVVTAGSGTLGTTGVGGSSDTFSANLKRVNVYTLAAPGTVSKLSIYLAPTSTTGQANIKGVIYSDSGGSPNALLAVSNELLFSSTQAAGWYDMTLPAVVNLAAGTYWIGVITGGTTGVAGFRYASVSGSRDKNSNTYTSGPTNPFGAFTSDGEQMSLYATYTPS